MPNAMNGYNLKSHHRQSVHREPLDICISTIDVALRRGASDEAKAAIDRYFATINEPDPITEDSSVFAIGLPTRIANLLDKNRIHTLGGLRAYIGRMWQVRQFGPECVRACHEALARLDAAEAREEGDE